MHGVIEKAKLIENGQFVFKRSISILLGSQYICECQKAASMHAASSTCRCISNHCTHKTTKGRRAMRAMWKNGLKNRFERVKFNYITLSYNIIHNTKLHYIYGCKFPFLPDIRIIYHMNMMNMLNTNNKRNIARLANAVHFHS